MPQVGKKKFPYTEKGKKAARAEEIARVEAENLESFRRAGVPEKGPWTKAQTRRVNEVLREMRKERARGKAAKMRR